MRTALLITAWLLVTGGIALALGSSLDGDRKELFLPGHTTSGHFQIEEDCSICHTPMQGVKQDACTSCHRDELDALDDSHRPSKFLDPRNFEIIAKLDARLCVTCHQEHSPESTDEGAATRPRGFCQSCHADIATERPSHRDVAFTSCQDAGCHNFHDNRALTEDFLEAHEGEPALLESPVVTLEHVASHDEAGVTCVDCHGRGDDWKDHPGDASCQSCHENQAETFGRGRHGMRAANDLSRMTPSLARLPMQSAAANRELGCTSCHGAHEPDRRTAAVEACLGCHADEHSLAYEGSPHHQAWIAELAGTLPPGSGVSCATCHMPRLHGTPTHNQSEMMRPVEKMIRPVCQECHGLDFALDALADPARIDDNFRGPPRPRAKLPRPERGAP